MAEMLVHSDPRILGGVPVIVGTHIPVYAILEDVASYCDCAKVAVTYGLNEEQVKAAIAYTIAQLKSERRTE